MSGVSENNRSCVCVRPFRSQKSSTLIISFLLTHFLGVVVLGEMEAALLIDLDGGPPQKRKLTNFDELVTGGFDLPFG